MLKSRMIAIYKPLGATPLQAIKLFVGKNPDCKNKTLSYAGRLDPMAEGLLLILVGEENKKRRELEHLDKEYEFEALLGMNSDTYDILGLVSEPSTVKIAKTQIEDYIAKNKGKMVQEYPPYSAIRVNGKPLYYWARKGKKVVAPKKEINIIDFKMTGEYRIDSKELFDIVVSRVSSVHGDFRQGKILEKWNEVLKNTTQTQFQIVKFKLSCSAGGYVRGVVQKLGEDLGVGALTYSIKRTKVGNFELKDALKLS